MDLLTYLSYLPQTLVGIALSPILIPILLAKGIQETYPHYREYYTYKLNNDIRYVDYDDIPDLALPKFGYRTYNSYKDKIMVVEDGKMFFAYKHIDKNTNQIVYVTNDNKPIEVDIELYKIKK